MILSLFLVILLIATHVNAANLVSFCRLDQIWVTELLENLISVGPCPNADKRDKFIESAISSLSVNADDDNNAGCSCLAHTKLALSNSHLLWPKGEIPYRSINRTSEILVYDDCTNLSRIQNKQLNQWQDTIQSALKKWSDAVALQTNVRFVDSPERDDILQFIFTCGFVAAPVGRDPNSKLIYIPYDASVGQVLHEMMHVAGLLHEHQRFDRSNWHVSVNNQDEQYSIQGWPFGLYDKYSLLHYLPNEILHVPKDWVNDKRFAQRQIPTDGDLQALSSMYCNEQQCERKKLMPRSPHPLFTCLECQKSHCLACLVAGNCVQKQHPISVHISWQAGRCDGVESENEKAFFVNVRSQILTKNTDDAVTLWQGHLIGDRYFLTLPTNIALQKDHVVLAENGMIFGYNEVRLWYFNQRYGRSIQIYLPEKIIKLIHMNAVVEKEGQVILYLVDSTGQCWFGKYESNDWQSLPTLTGTKSLHSFQIQNQWIIYAQTERNVQVLMNSKWQPILLQRFVPTFNQWFSVVGSYSILSILNAQHVLIQWQNELFTCKWMHYVDEWTLQLGNVAPAKSRWLAEIQHQTWIVTEDLELYKYS